MALASFMFEFILVVITTIPALVYWLEPVSYSISIFPTPVRYHVYKACIFELKSPSLVTNAQVPTTQIPWKHIVNLTL